MRILAIALALALSACGPSTQSSDDALDPNERALPYGAVVGVGENWTLNADPAVQGVSFVIDEGAEGSGVWTPPQTVEGGYRLTAGDIIVDLRDTACTMNGAAYPMRATVTLGGQNYEGCAAMRWDYQLLAFMPQIDACLAQSPDTRYVTYAGIEDDRAVLVRLQDAEAMIDCRVLGGVAAIGPRDETLSMPSESNAIFVRARLGETQNPGGECYEAPEVHGVHGEVLGWMLDPMGC